MGLVALLLIGGGVILAVMHTEGNKGANSSQALPAAKKAATTPAVESTTATKDNTAAPKGTYAAYDQSKLANAIHGKVVLFFHAPWCPTCKEADQNFNSTATPDGLTLLKTDYDSSTDLKRKYGVTYQHTFVQVDKDGNLIKKWSGSNSYSAIQNELL